MPIAKESVWWGAQRARLDILLNGVELALENAWLLVKWKHFRTNSLKISLTNKFD